MSIEKRIEKLEASSAPKYSKKLIVLLSKLSCNQYGLGPASSEEEVEEALSRMRQARKAENRFIPFFPAEWLRVHGTPHRPWTTSIITISIPTSPATFI